MKPPGPLMTVSIRYGTGLAEAYLFHMCPGLHLRALEVNHEATVEITKGNWGSTA